MSKIKHLLEDLKPKNYHLSLNLDEKALKFNGKVVISAKLLKSAHQIYLHAHQLKITKAKVTPGKSAGVTVEYLPKQQLIKLTSDGLVPTGEIEIELEFSGKISQSMVGIYPGKAHSNQDVILATQLESHHAREVFPCIDEPSAKAVFELTLETTPGLQVLSNTQAISTKAAKAKVTTKFAPTPIMSTYLLAFVVGELVKIESKTKNGTKVRVWATKNKGLDFALDTAVKSLNELEKFFDLPYPLEKCDLVALPDFASGAMENWGLITFREVALIVDEGHSSLADKQWVTKVIAHELAHQWFGNLVTMHWWTDLWLNESFASWMENHITDILFPEWQIWDDFVAGDMQEAMSLDQLVSSHAVKVDINDPDEIRTIFDAISYDKGASLINMLAEYLGLDDFTKGLQLYIKKFSYQNTKTSDLWDCLEKSSGRPVRSIMSAWTNQVGFPVVKAENGDSLHLSQRRFLINPDSADKNNNIWPVPIFIGDKVELFESSKATFKNSRPEQPLNQNQTGFYITDYSPQLTQRLLSKLDELGVREQIGLISDLFRLVRAGQKNIDEVLGVISFYKELDNEALAQVVIGNLMAVRRVLASHDMKVLAKYDSYVADFIGERLQKLGWNQTKDDTHNHELLRTLLLQTAVTIEEPTTIAQALKRFDMANQLENLSPHSRSSVLRGAVLSSDKTVYKKLWQWYLASDSSQAKQTIVGALTSVKTQLEIKQNLDSLMSDKIKLQDLHSWLAGMLDNPNAREITWQWLQHNWSRVTKPYGTDVSSLTRFPYILGYLLFTAHHLKQFNKFFASRDVKYMQNKIDQAREQISWKAQWHQRDAKALARWLQVKASIISSN